MTWKDLEPGVYAARIRDFGLEEVQQLNNAIKVVIILDVFVHQETATETLVGKWDGLLETKDGAPNAKTMKTLAICGMSSDDIMDLTHKAGALDRSLDLEVQVIKDPKGYTRIDWINRPGGASMIKKTTPKVRPSAAVKAALAEARRNVGPSPSSAFDKTDSEIPF